MARTSTYDKVRHPALGAALAQAGKTDEEICALLEISNRTLYYWRKKYPEFAQALADGKEPVNDAVEASLLKQAMGYEIEDIETVYIPGADGKPMVKQVRKMKKQVPASVAAQIFFLKNRRPDQWRDVQRNELSGNLTVSTLADAITQCLPPKK